MNPVTKTLLYIIICVKIILLLSMARYYLNDYFYPNDTTEQKEIYLRKETLHETFMFLMYILLLLLFNPLQNNIKLNEPSSEKEHIKLLIFTLGLIGILHFD